MFIQYFNLHTSESEVNYNSSSLLFNSATGITFLNETN
jgi:hypothetical protein